MALAGLFGGGQDTGPQSEQQFVGGSVDAQNQRYTRDNNAVDQSTAYTNNLLQRREDPYQQALVQQNRQGAMLAAQATNRALAAGPNPYLGRTDQDVQAARMLQEQAAQNNMAAAQSVGGAAGARAAAGANAQAAIEAQRVQALTAAQERASMASIYSQDQARSASVALQAEQARTGATQAGMNATNAFDLSRGQLAATQAGTFVSNQQAMDQQAAANAQQHYDNQVAEAERQRKAQGGFLGGLGSLAEAGLSIYTGGLSNLAKSAVGSLTKDEKAAQAAAAAK